MGRLTLASQPPPGAVSPGLSDNATRTDVVKGRRPMQRRGTGPAEPASGRGATAAPVRTGTKQGHPRLAWASGCLVRNAQEPPCPRPLP